MGPRAEDPPPGAVVEETTTGRLGAEAPAPAAPPSRPRSSQPVAYTQDLYGRKLFWLSVKALEEVEEGTDRWAVRHGMVAMTPLRLDLTDGEALAVGKKKKPME